MVGIVAATQPVSGGCSGTALASSPTTLPFGPLSAKTIVRYLETNGFSANAAAGIVGNMVQESGLDPGLAGGGLVQNTGTQYALQAAYDHAHGLDPSSAQGQLAFVVDYTKKQPWFSQLNNAKTPQDAALWFQDNYEQCSGAGARGTDQVGGGLCYPQHRMDAAAAALTATGGGSATFVGTTTGCAGSVSAGPGQYVNPFQRSMAGLVSQRIDMGVDYDNVQGAEIDAIGRAKIIAAATGIGGGWTCGGGPNGGVYYQLLDGPHAGRRVYVTEDVIPSVKAGDLVAAGQKIAEFSGGGLCIEIGWGSGTPWGTEAAALGQQASGDPGNNQTYCGQLMSQLIASLGGKPGTAQQPKSGSSCPVM